MDRGEELEPIDLSVAEEYWNNTGSILALAESLLGMRQHRNGLPEWAIDGLLYLIADILQNERSGYSRQWTEAQSARKNAILAELDIFLQFMRERKDSHPEFVAQLSRGLKRQFSHFDGQLGRNREEDRLIAGELVSKKFPYEADTVKK